MFPIDYMYLTEDEEKKLFEEAYIYFDASALLDLYYFSDEAAKDIFDNLISKSAQRNYITEQNWFEFNKNKDTVRIKPVNSYNRLINNPAGNKNIDGAYIQKIKEELNSIKNNALKPIMTQGDQFFMITKTSDKHPFITKDLRERFKKQLDDFKAEFDDLLSHQIDNYELLCKEIEKEIALQIKLINSGKNQNNIPNMIDNSFKIVPVNYTFTNLLEIIKEGEIRYKNKIPPGYEDDPAKEGIQKYGDLISWKQLLAHSKVNGTASIYITNDKKDMFSTDTASPKLDLIKEHYDNNDNRFWIFNLSDFIYRLQKHSSLKLKAETKIEVEEYKDSKEADNILNEPLPDISKVFLEREVRNFRFAMNEYLSRNSSLFFRNEKVDYLKEPTRFEFDFFGISYYSITNQEESLVALYLRKTLTLSSAIALIIHSINTTKYSWVKKIEILVCIDDPFELKKLILIDHSNLLNQNIHIKYSLNFAIYDREKLKIEIV